jgi:hypothetical protein
VFLPLPASEARGEGWGEGLKRKAGQGQQRLRGTAAPFSVARGVRMRPSHSP